MLNRRLCRVQAEYDYIKTWYESIKSHAIDGVVIGNMFLGMKEFQQEHDYVTYVETDPATDHIINNPKNKERSINDLVYDFSLDWIEKNTGPDDYIIVSDVHDVTYMQNPFPWMRATDEVCVCVCFFFFFILWQAILDQFSRLCVCLAMMVCGSGAGGRPDLRGRGVPAADGAECTRQYDTDRAHQELLGILLWNRDARSVGLRCPL